MSLFNILVAFLIFTFSFNSVAFSASVKKVKRKKRYVYIDQGSSDGVKKGMKVCFKDNNDKKITCGKVRKTRKKSSQVKVRSKKRIKRIKKGFTAEVIGLETPPVGGLIPPNVKTAGETSSSEKSLAFRYFYTPGLDTGSYNILGYVPPPSDSSVAATTLWEATGVQNLSLLNFSLEFEYLPVDLVWGLSYSKPINVQGKLLDYTRGAREPFISSLMDSSTVGTYFDYYIISPRAVSSGLKVAVGLDIDITSVKFSAKLRQNEADTGLEIYKLSSSLTIFSLRIPLSYEVSLGSFALNFGANLLIPLASTKPVSKINISDSNISRYNQSSDEENKSFAETDVTAALDHKKSSFAAELVLGFGYAL
jgi:hypothetical protein